ncbi:MAG TPA: ACT domain-containing protein [Symbiobacteriaceae bacterium]
MSKLFKYPERYAIVSLDATAAIPPVAFPSFYACIRDKNEITLIMPEDLVPPRHSQVTKGYRIVMLDTEFAFDVVGVLAACSAALAQAGIPIMAYSSYKTDVFMIQDEHFAQACAMLAGLQF